MVVIFIAIEPQEKPMPRHYETTLLESQPDEDDDERTTPFVVATERDGRVLAQALYQELRKLARARMQRLPPGQTLQPTALVHEVYLRMMGDNQPDWNGRRHFFGAAARAMRDILVEHARHKATFKRGRGQVRCHSIVTFADGDDAMHLSAEDVIALQRALDKLEREHPQMAELALLRYFGGLSVREIAETWGVTTRAVEKKWTFARAWLQRALGTGTVPGDDDAAR
ncbi:MAG TPA: ECF-type sigma factor [Haliangium sp.]|nr:ECF-type sigma factor [Haliangium sp.]